MHLFFDRDGVIWCFSSYVFYFAHLSNTFAVSQNLPYILLVDQPWIWNLAQFFALVSSIKMYHKDILGVVDSLP